MRATKQANLKAKKMAKLTNYMRETIANLAVAHTFDPRKAALDKAEDALAREAYASIYPEAELKKVNALPGNWFRPDACLRFNVGGLTIRLNVIGGGLPVPYRAKGEKQGGFHCNQLGVIPHGDLCDRIQAHATACEKYKEERTAAAKACAVMLSRVTTTAKLSEAWPEGEQFFKKFHDEPKAALPMVRVDEVNSLLGLAAA